MRSLETSSSDEITVLEITQAAVAFSAILSLLAIYTPPGNFVLGTEPLAMRHLFEVIALAALPTLGLSALKEIFGFRFL